MNCFGRDQREYQETANVRGQTDIQEGTRHLSELLKTANQLKFIAGKEKPKCIE